MSDVAAIPPVITRARDEVARLCAGRGRMTQSGLAGRGWTMCIPVQKDDSDVVFADLIEAAAGWERELASYRAAAAAEQRGPGSGEDVRKALLQLLDAMERLYPMATGLSHAMGLLARDATRLRAIERGEWAVAPQVGGGWVIEQTEAPGISGDAQEEEIARTRGSLGDAIDMARTTIANRNATATAPENTNAPREGGASELLSTEGVTSV